MVLLKDLLPAEVWQKIYEFDPSLREAYLDTIRDFKGVMALMTVVLMSHSPEQLQKSCNKKELVKLAKFLHIHVPSHHTKRQIAWVLFTFITRVVPSLGYILINELKIGSEIGSDSSDNSDGDDHTVVL